MIEISLYATVSIYLAAITLIYSIHSVFGIVLDGKFREVYEHKYLKVFGRVWNLNKLIRLLDFKPLNCKFCLSYWIGIILAICLGDILYLSLPLIYLIKG